MLATFLFFATFVVEIYNAILYRYNINMESVIRLLPDVIANQIAAGEVVQRPASVVKELMENGIDAGAKKIELYLKDAGKTLIQIADDGKGMSAQDARMCFERHATSKIREKDDLFKINTLGFRGEALASIAAVAQVRLKTRLQNMELGTEIEIEGNDIKKQEPCVCSVGTMFQVKNLFFNVPARRNFLKSDAVETRHIMNEFLRIALPNPEIAFTFKHNETLIYDLRAVTLKERIVALCGSELKQEISFLEELTGYVKISGYIGSPKVARRTREEQYFFVNGRYIKSPFLHHAIAGAYEASIPKDKHPFYCIFLEINPIHVDINIHPTKTEVKFDDEHTLYVLLNGAIKRNLGAFHSSPTLDFEDNVNDDLQKKIYAPFVSPKPQSAPFSFPSTKNNYFEPIEKTVVTSQDWKNFYEPPKSIEPPTENIPSLQPQLLPQDVEHVTSAVMIGSQYVVAEKDKTLYIIHIQNAQERVFYERFLQKTANGAKVSIQQLLFPQTFEFSPADKWLLLENEAELLKMGLEIKDFQGNTLILYGAPSDLPQSKIRETLEQVIADIKEIGKQQLAEKLPERFAKNMAIRNAAFKTIQSNEAKHLAESLLSCKQPQFSPTGKATFKILPENELTAFFNH